MVAPNPREESAGPRRGERPGYRNPRRNHLQTEEIVDVLYDHRPNAEQRRGDGRWTEEDRRSPELRKAVREELHVNPPAELSTAKTVAEVANAISKADLIPDDQ